MADFASNGFDSKVYNEELLNSVTDEYGVVYSNDRRKLLKTTSTFDAKNYTVVNGCIVICDNAFAKSSTLTEINIPSSVVLLGKKAFEGCENLNRIILPVSLQTIEDECFAWCLNLKSLSLPHNIKSIKYGAFEGCDSIKSLTLPNSLAFIGENAFKGLSNISKVVIPASVYEIKDEAFANCFLLKEVVFKGKISNLSEDCFEDCDKLESIIVPEADLEYFETLLPENLKGLIKTEKETQLSPQKKDALRNLLATLIALSQSSSKKEALTYSDDSFPSSTPSKVTSNSYQSSFTRSSTSNSRHSSSFTTSSSPSPYFSDTIYTSDSSYSSKRIDHGKKSKWGKIFAGLLVFVLLSLVTLCLIFYFTENSIKQYDDDKKNEEEISSDYSEEFKDLWSAYLNTNEGRIMQTVANLFYFTRNEDFNRVGFEKLISEDVNPKFVENVGVPSILRYLTIHFTPPVDFKSVMTPELCNLYDISFKNPLIPVYFDSIGWNPIEEINQNNIFTIRNIQIWGNDSLAYLYYFQGEVDSEAKPSIISLTIDRNRWKINDFIKNDISFVKEISGIMDVFKELTRHTVWEGRVYISQQYYPFTLTLNYENGEITEVVYNNPDYDTTIILNDIRIAEDGVILKGNKSNSKLTLKLKEENNGDLKGLYEVESGNNEHSYEVILTPQDKNNTVNISTSETTSDEETNDILYLMGKIDEKYGVHMILNLKTKEGSYYYDRYGPNNKMKLVIKNTNNNDRKYIEMIGYDNNGERCETWEGYFNNNVFQGSGIFQGQSMPFYLQTYEP